MDLISIGNVGPEIASTNYWDSDQAQLGLLYVSPNAGVLRLLVPSESERILPDMRTGKKAIVENSIVRRGAVDIVFDDGTQSPFCVTLDRKQFSAIPKRGAWGLSIWTREGKQIELACQVESTGNWQSQVPYSNPDPLCALYVVCCM